MKELSQNEVTTAYLVGCLPIAKCFHTGGTNSLEGSWLLQGRLARGGRGVRRRTETAAVRSLLSYRAQHRLVESGLLALDNGCTVLGGMDAATSLGVQSRMCAAFSRGGWLISCAMPWAGTYVPTRNRGCTCLSVR